MKISNFERKYSASWLASHDLYWENKVDKPKRSIPEIESEVFDGQSLKLGILFNFRKQKRNI